MKTEIQPKTQIVTFKCASCGSEFKIESTYHNEVCNIDVCSHCHPWYMGKTSSTANVAKSDKLTNKFETGKQFKNTKKVSVHKEEKPAKASSKMNGFSDLEADATAESTSEEK